MTCSALLGAALLGACVAKSNGGSACKADEVFLDNACQLPCNRHSECPVGSHCGAGLCVPGDAPCGGARDCDDGRSCTDDRCDSGACVYTQVAACDLARCSGDSDCNDSVVCTTDRCEGGGCYYYGDDLACDDSNVCTEDHCTATGCVPINLTGACSDGDLCTTGDVCSGGQCIATPIECSTTTSCRESEGVCDPGSGDCAFSAAPPDTPCDDGDPCTPSDACDVDGNCQPGASICPSPLSRIQRGKLVMATDDDSVSAQLAALALDKSFLLFSARFGLGTPDFTEVSCRLTDTPTVVCARHNAPGPEITIEWQVVELSSGVRVQRGSVVEGAAGGQPTHFDIALSPVDPSHTFILASHLTIGTIYDDSDQVAGELLDADTLRLTVFTSLGSGQLDWQVVELDSAVVQAGGGAVASGSRETRVALDTPNAGKTWLTYGLYSEDVADNANFGHEAILGSLDAEEVIMSRLQAGPSVIFRFAAVRFTDFTTVQSGVASLDADTLTLDVPIAPVDPSRSFAVGGYGGSSGSTDYTGLDAGVFSLTFELAGASSLRLTRGVTGTARTDAVWWVVSF